MSHTQHFLGLEEMVPFKYLYEPRAAHFYCFIFLSLLTVDPSSALQAPANMKSVLQAGWLLTVAFGNVIVLIVAEGAGLEQVRCCGVLWETLSVCITKLSSTTSCFYVHPSTL